MANTGTSIHSLMTAKALEVEPRRHTKLHHLIEPGVAELWTFTSPKAAKQFLADMKDAKAHNTNEISVTNRKAPTLGAG